MSPARDEDLVEQAARLHMQFIRRHFARATHQNDAASLGE